MTPTDSLLAGLFVLMWAYLFVQKDSSQPEPQAGANGKPVAAASASASAGGQHFGKSAYRLSAILTLAHGRISEGSGTSTPSSHASRTAAARTAAPRPRASATASPCSPAQPWRSSLPSTGSTARGGMRCSCSDGTARQRRARRTAAAAAVGRKRSHGESRCGSRLRLAAPRRRHSHLPWPL